MEFSMLAARSALASLGNTLALILAQAHSLLTGSTRGSDDTLVARDPTAHVASRARVAMRRMRRRPWNDVQPLCLE